MTRMGTQGRFLPLFTGLLGLALSGCGGGTRPVQGARVAILGFDGVDYRLLTSMMEAGHLPALSSLAAQGSFSPLASTVPAESPVAWAAFATGSNPGKTRIFDFLKR